MAIAVAVPLLIGCSSSPESVDAPPAEVTSEVSDVVLHLTGMNQKLQIL